MKAVVARLNRFLQGLIGAILGAVTILVLVQIVLRRIFSQPIPWSEEVSRFALVWLTYLGAVAALRSGRHLSTGVSVQQLLPRPLAAALDAAMFGTVAVALALVAWDTYGTTLRSLNYGASSLPALRMAYVYGVVPLATIAMAAMWVVEAWNRLLDYRRSSHEKEFGDDGHAPNEAARN